MPSDLTKRSFLAGMAAVTAAAFKPSGPALGATGPAMRVMGYGVQSFATTPRFSEPGTAFFMAGETLASLKDSVRRKANYEKFYAAIKTDYENDAARMQDMQTPFYDKTIFTKAAAVHDFVNTHYKYSTAPHPNGVAVNIYGPNGEIAGAVTVAQGTSSVLSPSEIFRNGGLADCVDYAAAKFAGLKYLGVPPEDLLYVVGSVHNDRASLSRSYEQAGHFHAWTMVRSPGSNEWLILETNAETTLVIAENATMDNIKSYYTPVVAMNGNMQWIYVDSLDKNGVPKPQPSSAALVAEIREPKPVRNNPTAPSASGQKPAL